jgi:protein-S-isoprenylcysteine O-methyltransferase Ste14
VSFIEELWFTFPTVIETVLFSTVFIIWAASEIIVHWIIPKLRHSDSEIKKQPIRSVLAAYVCEGTAIVLAVIFNGGNIAMLPNWVFYIGITLMLLGIILRLWGIAILGRFFYGIIGIQKGQKVIDSGPYQLIRHPTYAGTLLVLIGLELAIQSWGAMIIILPILYIMYSYRIKMEEEVLKSQLGNEYIEYTKRTKKLIPYIL